MTTTLQEMVMSAHFEAPLNFGVVELAGWIAAFAEEYPTLQQLPVAPPVSIAPMPVQFNIMPVGTLPRVVLSSPRTNRIVQLQADRIACGWTRSQPIGDPADYPGYDVMMSTWRAILDKFHDWYAATFGGKPNIKLVELSYNNAIPALVEGRPRRMSEVFRFVQPGRTVNMFQVIWSESLTEDENGARVAAQFAIGTALPDQKVFGFNFHGLSPATGAADDPAAVGALDALHARILDIRAAQIISDADG